MKRIVLIVFLQLMACYGFGQVNEFIEEGIASHDKGEYNKAIEFYQKALSIEPKSSLANYEISYTYLEAKEYDKAEKYSRKVIGFNDGHLLPAYIIYGSALDLQGKTKKALKAYEEGIKDFDNYLLYYNHAITCFNSGDIEKAYSSTIKAINNNSSHASSHLLLSNIMDSKGIRIKTILPLYFFLLIEPNSPRSKGAYQLLRSKLNYGVERTSETSINVLIPKNEDSDFGAAEMVISLSNASNNIEENKNKTEFELFSKNNKSLFKILGELKNENGGFWWDFYVPFFYDLANEKLTESYSYYISQSLEKKEVTKWLEENDNELQRLKEWVNE